MKFAHLADCHIGGWKDERMSKLSILAFERALETCVDLGVDFVLIAGDLFNTSLPQIDLLKQVVSNLRRLKDKGIRVYMIAGSHDFSPSGKTMLDVLEEAGLIVNVLKGSVEDGLLKLNFTIDPTGAKITGMLGKKGSLEKKYYENLMRSHLESEDGYKIFMFHSALHEFKPKELEKMDAHPLSLLPKNFDYYAGGHVHYIFEKDEAGYGKIVYPGALFPNNFSEMEKYSHGGFYLVENGVSSYVPVKIKEHKHISVVSEHNTPLEVENKIIDKLDFDCSDMIVSIRFSGILEQGRVTDIDFSRIYEKLSSAYFVMRNTNQLKTKEFDEIKIKDIDAKVVEKEMIKEHLNQVKVSDMDLEREEELTHSLMHVLNTERLEGEKVADFQKRVLEEATRILK